MWKAIFAAIAVFALEALRQAPRRRENSSSLKENFVRNNRVKRGVPSDSPISPSVAAPTKSLHNGEDQRRVKLSAKSLSASQC